MRHTNRTVRTPKTADTHTDRSMEGSGYIYPIFHKVLQSAGVDVAAAAAASPTSSSLLFGQPVKFAGWSCCSGLRRVEGGIRLRLVVRLDSRRPPLQKQKQKKKLNQKKLSSSRLAQSSTRAVLPSAARAPISCLSHSLLAVRVPLCRK